MQGSAEGRTIPKAASLQVYGTPHTKMKRCLDRAAHLSKYAHNSADTIIPDFEAQVKMIIDQTYFPDFIQYDE